jgi:hypothetical protein
MAASREAPVVVAALRHGEARSRDAVRCLYSKDKWVFPKISNYEAEEPGLAVVGLESPDKFEGRRWSDASGHKLGRREEETMTVAGGVGGSPGEVVHLEQGLRWRHGDSALMMERRFCSRTDYKLVGHLFYGRLPKEGNKPEPESTSPDRRSFAWSITTIWCCRLA